MSVINYRKYKTKADFAVQLKKDFIISVHLYIEQL